MSIDEILQLPPADRLEIAEQIWNSILPEDLKITEAQKDELDSRIAIDKAEKMKWYSLAEFKKRLDNK